LLGVLVDKARHRARLLLLRQMAAVLEQQRRRSRKIGTKELQRAARQEGIGEAPDERGRDWQIAQFAGAQQHTVGAFDRIQTGDEVPHHLALEQGLERTLAEIGQWWRVDTV
jgi:hypothetical protein